MRIAYVSTDPGIPVWGAKGASIHVQEMLRALLRRGNRVSVLSPRVEGTPPRDLAAVDVHALPAAPKGEPEARARALVAAGSAVVEALERLAPEFVYERHALYSSAAMEWADARDLASVLEVNAPLAAEQAAHRTLVLPGRANALARRSMIASGLVVAVSDAVARHARRNGARRVTVEANGVDPARFPTPAPLGDGPFTVGFLGSLKPWHGLPTLARAFVRFRAVRPDARLLLVGDGPERARIESLLADDGSLDAVEFTGLLPPADVPSALARMHVGTAPYGADGDFYFSPLKVYEYMAAGLPVIASDVGHLARVVADGRTGLVVPPDAPEALTDALLRLSEDLPGARAMGGAGRAEVLARCTWDRLAERVLARAFEGRGTIA